MPHAPGAPRDRFALPPVLLGRTAPENTIQQEYNIGKRKHGKDRLDLFVKTPLTTIATIDANFNDQVDQMLAIEALQDELDARDTEMNDNEATRKLRPL